MPRSSGLHAVILAAGLGSRLRAVVGDLPKALLPVGGRTLIERSVERLEAQGVASLTVVVGFGASALRPVVARLRPDARILENQDPAGTGSMRSLALAVESWGDASPPEILVVEGDLLFGADALRALHAAPDADATVLCSTPTGAGDEVWVRGRDGRVAEIGKGAGEAGATLGELVGLTRIRRRVLQAMVHTHRAGGSATVLEHYEERLAAVADRFDVRALVVDGLAWAEIDDAGHMERAVRDVLPRISPPD